MKIVHSKSASDTPAFALIAEGWNELVQTGMTPDGRGDSPVTWKNEVLFAVRDDGEIVGVLCYEHQEPVNAFEVTLAYVEPTSRKQGVYSELYAALIAKAKERAVIRIGVTANADNRAMLEVLAKLNSRLVSFSYETLLD